MNNLIETENEDGAACCAPPAAMLAPVEPYTGPRTAGEVVTIPPIYPPDGSKPFRAVVVGFIGETHFAYRSEDGRVTGTRLLANIIEDGEQEQEGGCCNV